MTSYFLRFANRSFRPDGPAWPRPVAMLAMLAVLAVPGLPAAAQTTTTTTLTLSSSSVATGTAVLFTAAVSNGSEVTLGTVTFCNAAYTYCLAAPALVGTAQLTAAGTAEIKLTPGIGVHSYKAIFKATTSNAGSTSSAQALTVTGVYTPAAGTIPATGSDILSVTFTPTNTAGYNNATATVTLTVKANISRIIPTISWATPAGISSGTALSSTQLNAAASVAGNALPGTYLYSPAAGTTPAIGLDTLTVVFTPTNSVDYTTATATVVLTVGDFFSLNLVSASIQTVQPGTSAPFSFTVAPAGISTIPGPVTFTVTGLPPGATATFSPATIAAGGSTTTVKLTIKTSSSQTAKTGPQQNAPIALGMLLLPMLGIVSLRKRLGKMPQLRAAVVFGVLSLSAIMGGTGCAGATGTVVPPPTYSEYTVAVTAHCGTLQSSANVTVKIEN
jgi:hypothetical protein